MKNADDGRIVRCRPDLGAPHVVQQVSRVLCLTTPYAACQFCPNHNFEYVFATPSQDDWVACPRWSREAGTGPPSFYTPVWLSECRAKPHPFCPKCPSREALVQLLTDKQKEGWLERYRKLTHPEEEDDDD